jgi:3-hydroxyisobutyrate dehydrogenase-like beta-hydroxyacid dehydrogenase
MCLGIIGSGNMGASMGKTWASKGHKVLFSYSKDPAKLRAVAEAAAFGEVISQRLTRKDPTVFRLGGYPQLAPTVWKLPAGVRRAPADLADYRTNAVSRLEHYDEALQLKEKG